MHAELGDDVGRVRDGPARGLAVHVPEAARLGGERGVVVAHPVEEHQGEKEGDVKGGVAIVGDLEVDHQHAVRVGDQVLRRVVAVDQAAPSGQQALDLRPDRGGEVGMPCGRGAVVGVDAALDQRHLVREALGELGAAGGRGVQATEQPSRLLRARGVRAAGIVLVAPDHAAAGRERHAKDVARVVREHHLGRASGQAVGQGSHAVALDEHTGPVEAPLVVDPQLGQRLLDHHCAALPLGEQDGVRDPAAEGGHRDLGLRRRHPALAQIRRQLRRGQRVAVARIWRGARIIEAHQLAKRGTRAATLSPSTAARSASERKPSPGAGSPGSSGRARYGQSVPKTRWSAGASIARRPR